MCCTAGLLNETYDAACPGSLQVYVFKSLEGGDGELPLSAFCCAAVARRQEYGSGRAMHSQPLEKEKPQMSSFLKRVKVKIPEGQKPESKWETPKAGIWGGVRLSEHPSHRFACLDRAEWDPCAWEFPGVGAVINGCR